MPDQPLEIRVEPKENPNIRWLIAIPLVGILGAGVTSYRLLADPNNVARKAFQAQYGTQSYMEDVNGDGIFENVVRLKNPANGMEERRILEFRNGELVLRKYEVKDGRINYLD